MLELVNISLNTDFKYLGSKMASAASDLKRRNALAWSAFGKWKECGEVPN